MKPRTLILAVAAVAMNIGCAQEKNNDAGSTVATPVVACSRGECTTGGSGLPDAPGGSGGTGGTGYYSGATASLTIASGALRQMFYNSYPNNPQSAQINIDLSRKADAIVISYIDNGKTIEAGLGVQFPGGSRQNEQYNGWVKQTVGMSTPTPVYKGFFQDAYGAVVIVIDKTLNLGDGTPAQYVGGSVWFQNFGDGQYGESTCQSGDPRYGTCYSQQKMCWEITYGPYDCTTFRSGNSIVMNSSLYPTNHGETRTKSYQKLGDFSGMSRAAAGL